MLKYGLPRGTFRRKAWKGAAVAGVTVVGIGYYQRLPRTQSDPRTSSRESFTTRLYRDVAAPFVMQLDPETAHNLALSSARVLQALRLLAEPSWTGPTPLDWLFRPAPSVVPTPGPTLCQELFGGRLRFESPVGIAAGFDKNAVLVPLYRLGAFPGHGFTEVGSVSAEPSAGNPRPRCFRLPGDKAVINRMGLNNEGCEAIAERLQKFEVLGRAGDATGPKRNPVGINIAKTHSPEILGEAALDDFAKSFRTLEPYGDFMVVNVSCPNTAEGKTFEEPDALGELLGRVSASRSRAPTAPPVLVKFSAPPATPEGQAWLQSLVATARASGACDGFVMSNTLPEREGLLSSEGLEAASAAGKGGLSGRPTHKRSVSAIRTIYEMTRGELPIIGVGGIDSPEAAYASIRAGASLVEVYTGMVYDGPGLLADLHLGLRRLLERDGFKSISEAVGADVRSP